jgi:hypothetical protein
VIVAIHCNEDGVRISRFTVGGETVLHDPNHELRRLAVQVWQAAGGEMNSHIAIDTRLNEVIARVARLELELHTLRASLVEPPKPVGASQSHTSRPQEGVAILPFTTKSKPREYHE